MTHFTARNRSHLEALWQQPATDCNVLARRDAAAPKAADTLRQFAHSLLAFFTGSQQLRIWTKSTKQGVVWFAYDPTSDRRIAHCSEDELRVWLETQHRH